MRHILTSILSLLIMGLTLASCSTNGSDIGDLYGTWKLEQLTCNAGTVKFDTIFIGFQGEAYEYQVNWKRNWGVFEQSDDSLYLNKLQYGGNFKAIHIPSETAAFAVGHLGGNSLSLVRNDSVWTFMKYY